VTRTFSVLGVVVDGKLKIYDLNGFNRGLTLFGSGEEIEIEVRELHEGRSQRANRYYFGVVLKLISEETGHSVDDVHEAMVKQFLPDEQKQVEFFHRLTGEKMQVTVGGRRSSKLSREDFYTFVEQVRAWAGEFLGVTTPDPDPNFWRKRREEVRA
jgi:hypothetical protein